MIKFLISKKEYESIKSNKETMAIVEAKGECPMYIDISPHPRMHVEESED